MIYKASHFIISFVRKLFIVFGHFICILRSKYYSNFIDQGNGKISIADPFLRIKIRKSKGAKIIFRGDFRISPHLGGTTPVRIYLGENAIFKCDGDFVIGNGVRISISNNAELSLGGKDLESGSGITSDSLILVNKRVSIGRDFLCAWNVFISDSDWHLIENQKHHADILIGDHVWIANNSTILKGSRIGSGSIVASNTKVSGKEYPEKSLIAGMPAKVIKTGIKWHRDLN